MAVYLHDKQQWVHLVPRSHAVKVQNTDMAVDEAGSNVLTLHRPADLEYAAAACAPPAMKAALLAGQQDACLLELCRRSCDNMQALLIKLHGSHSLARACRSPHQALQWRMPTWLQHIILQSNTKQD